MKSFIKNHYPAIIATIVILSFVAMAALHFIHLVKIGAIN